MKIRILDLEFWVEKHTLGWSCEDFNHEWGLNFGVTWLSPYEKHHREELKELKRYANKK